MCIVSANFIAFAGVCIHNLPDLCFALNSQYFLHMLTEDVAVLILER